MTVLSFYIGLAGWGPWAIGLRLYSGSVGTSWGLRESIEFSEEFSTLGMGTAESGLQEGPPGTAIGHFLIRSRLPSHLPACP